MAVLVIFFFIIERQEIRNSKILIIIPSLLDYSKHTCLTQSIRFLKIELRIVVVGQISVKIICITILSYTTLIGELMGVKHVTSCVRSIKWEQIIKFPFFLSDKLLVSYHN